MKNKSIIFLALSSMFFILAEDTFVDIHSSYEGTELISTNSKSDFDEEDIGIFSNIESLDTKIDYASVSAQYTF
jgi:hypothetical protein